MARHPLGDSDQLVTDHQHPVIKSSDIAFDQNAFALSLIQRHVKGGFDLVIGSQVY